MRIYIVNDSAINAFVAGGQNIFIHTGLLLATDNVNQLIGVIAHETGHIAGGHLLRSQDALENASIQSLVAFALGAAAAVAGGGRAGAAITGAGQSMAQRSFMSFSREQEATADRAAMTFLDRTHQSAEGLLDFFKKLGDQEALLAVNQDPYVQTHPLTGERIQAVRDHVAHSPYSDAKEPEKFQVMYQRIKAKLGGFLNPPQQTYRDYPASDTSVPARYARAIAHHKQNQFDEALKIADGLIRESPDDPYFHELKGQILLESGHPDDAVGAYAAAVKAKPDEPMLRAELGQAQVSAEKDAYLDDAIKNLQVATQQAPLDPTGWRWLAMAYGRKNDVGNASLATAERYMLTGQVRDALQQAKRAEAMLPKGSPGHLRAVDIVQTAKTRLSKQE